MVLRGCVGIIKHNDIFMWGIECKCLLNESSDCLLTICCVHLLHDLMVLGKKECF